MLVHYLFFKISITQPIILPTNQITCMEKFYKRLIGPLLLVLLAALPALAQTNISGSVKDGTTGEPLAGASIVVRGTILGTLTNGDGEFSIKVSQSPPFTLIF